jgi:hypothetical protein
MMKRLALLFALSGMLLVAKADTIALYSSASTTSNNSVAEGIANAGPTVNIDANPAWAGPLAGSSWVSFTNTGNPSDSNFYTVPNGVSVIFSETFNLTGTITSAFLNVLADDTSSVVVNGVQIYKADTNGSYPTCSSTTIGCLTNTEGVFTSSQLLPLLHDGSNTISFTVYQEAGSSYGLDYAGGVTTPEPGSLLLAGAGLLGLLLLKARS